MIIYVNEQPFFVVSDEDCRSVRRQMATNKMLATSVLVCTIVAAGAGGCLGYLGFTSLNNPFSQSMIGIATALVFAIMVFISASGPYSALRKEPGQYLISEPWRMIPLREMDMTIAVAEVLGPDQNELRREIGNVLQDQDIEAVQHLLAKPPDELSPKLRARLHNRRAQADSTISDIARQAELASEEVTARIAKEAAELTVQEAEAQKAGNDKIARQILDRE